MDRLRHIPPQKTAEAMALPLGTIVSRLQEHTLDELLASPREYIISGKITSQPLRSLVELGLEVAISGEKNRLVLSTGSRNAILPRADEDDLIKYVRGADQRYESSSYTAHSHPGATIGSESDLPSGPDMRALSKAKRKDSMIFSRTGISHYTWSHPEDVETRLERFLQAMNPPRSLFTGHGQSLQHPEHDQIIKDFYSEEGALLETIPWGDDARVQRFLDAYFDQ